MYDKNRYNIVISLQLIKINENKIKKSRKKKKTLNNSLFTVLKHGTGEGNGHPLQYSCLENPWTEEPGGLQSMGSQSDTAERLTFIRPWDTPLSGYIGICIFEIPDFFSLEFPQTLIYQK